MKAKKIILNWLLMTVIPTTTVISCLDRRNRNFDVGYALENINSLNYIKYKNVTKFAHSVVESFSKAAPEYQSKLASYLKDFPVINYRTSVSSQNQELNVYSYTSGTLSDSKEFPGIASYDKSINYFIFRLNGKSKWSNGDKLTPSDFIDAFVYVLDLNTASQLLSEFLKLKVKNASQFVAAQISYAKKYKKLYKNPFGYIKNNNYNANDENSVYWVQRKDAFPLQIYQKSKSEINKMNKKERDDYLNKQNEEKKLVDKISFFAKNLGIYGDLNSSHPYTHIKDIKSSELKNPDLKTNKYQFADNVHYTSKSEELVYPNIFQIQTSFNVNSFQYVINELMRSDWLPINRKFVESIGGIEKFGLSLNNFLTQGPFSISNIIFGTGGSIVLKKNNNYWDVKNTIPNRIKIYFQTDPIVLFSLYEDGYISQSRLSGLFVQKTYLVEKNRKLLDKIGGRGTTALVFNLNKGSPGYKPILADNNLRKALFYAVDREETIKISGYDSSLPAYSFVDSLGDTGTLWRGIEKGAVSGVQKIGDSLYYDKHQPKNAKKMFPYKISSLISTSSIIGDFDKKDLFKNVQLAKKYFNEFQKKHPGNHTITYAYDSSNPNLQIGIAIQSAVKKIFGNKLKIEIKGYPKSIYETYYSSGRFEITYRNLDYLMNKTGGTSAFYLKDEVDKKEQKNIGFLENPTGGWTFKKVIKNKVGKLTASEKELKKRLKIEDFVWNKIYDLSHLPPDLKNISLEEKDVFLKLRWNSFLSGSSFFYNNKEYASDPQFITSENIYKMTISANKLIMEFCPVIPLFIVDNYFKISRIVDYETTIGGELQNYDYGYDYTNKPKSDLPEKY